MSEKPPKNRPDTASAVVKTSMLTSAHPLRNGWEDAFRAAGSGDPDRLLLEDVAPTSTDFDREEWRW